MRKGPRAPALLPAAIAVALFGAVWSTSGPSAHASTASSGSTATADAAVTAAIASVPRAELLQRGAEQAALLQGGGSAGAAGARAAAVVQGLSGPGGSWINLGPAPIPNGQTSPASAVSGRVTAIAIDPRDANVVYIGAAQGGVWRTNDGGGTWTPLMDTAASLSIGALALAPSSPSTLYVGTGEANFNFDGYMGIGVYRIDNADTAATVVGPINPAFATTDTFGGRSISRILVKADDPATIFVSTAFGDIGINGGPARGGNAPPLPPKGVWRSTNATAAAGSVTFTKLSVSAASNVAVTDLMYDPADGTGNTLFAGVFGSTSTGGIWRTANALGAAPSFTQVQTFSVASVRVAFAAALSGPVPTSTIFAATSESQTVGTQTLQGTLRVAPNGGSVAGSFAIVTTASGFCHPQCFYDIVVAVPPTDPTTIYLGGSTDGSAAAQAIIEKSTNGGTTFARVDASLHADEHAITLAPSNSSIIWAGNDGGVWKSTNGATTWATENTTGLSITQYMSIAVHPSDPTFTIGGTQDNGTVLLKPDGTYTRADFGDGGYSQIDQNAADNANVVMYHTYFNQTNVLVGFARVDTVATAVDNGWTFMGCSLNNVGTPVSANGIGCADAVNFYAPLALGPGSPNRVYFGTDRLYRSIDKGNNNTVVSQAPLQVGVPISTIGISAQSDNVRIVGLDNGKVFATTTGSATLTDVTPSDAAYKPQYVARAVIDPTNSNTAYIALSGFMGDGTAHVWKTTNLAGGAATWTQMATGIPDVPVDSLVVNPQTPATVYAGTDVGVYRSLDGGASWGPYGTGLPTVAVFDMGLTAPGSSQVLRISTHGRGQWQIPTQGPGTGVPEVPWLPLVVGAGAGAMLLPVGRRRRVS